MPLTLSFFLGKDGYSFRLLSLQGRQPETLPQCACLLALQHRQLSLEVCLLAPCLAASCATCLLRVLSLSDRLQCRQSVQAQSMKVLQRLATGNDCFEGSSNARPTAC